MRRSILEKTASFHGDDNFSSCIKQGGNDEFREILDSFINRHPFNPAFISPAPALDVATNTAPVPTT